MLIKMKIQVAGGFENNPNGVEPGDVVDVPEERALQYLRLHYAEPVVDHQEERAVAPKHEERATTRRRTRKTTAE